MGKPMVGLTGGIGAGKTLVGRLLAEFGGRVIESDRLAHHALREREIVQTLVGWWGKEILDATGAVDRSRVGRRVFADEAERKRLEGLLFPRIAALRREVVRELGAERKVRFCVIDAPLLVEAGLEAECDCVVFVDAEEEVRLERVRRDRGWDQAELRRRENMQKPLDLKRRRADHIVVNNSDLSALRGQVAHLANQVLPLAFRDTL